MERAAGEVGAGGLDAHEVPLPEDECDYDYEEDADDQEGDDVWIGKKPIHTETVLVDGGYTQ